MKRLLSVSASAGSGKTFSLAIRYLSLLFKGANPGGIVAVTFTNKAANEMKNRIVKFLKEIENKDVKNALINTTNLSEQNILNKRKNILNNFLTHDINIVTIDSFINKILRKFSWYTGFDSDFDISKDNKEIILNNFINSLNNNEFNSLVFLAKKEKNLSIEKLLELLYEKDKELPKIKFSYNKIDNNKIMQKFNKFKDYILNSPKSSSSAKKEVNKITGVKDFYNIGWMIDKKNGIKRKGFYEYSYFKKKSLYQDWFEEIYEEIDEYLKKDFQNRENYILQNLLNLYKKYKQTKWAYKKNTGLLDFKDIEHLVYQLLVENELDKDFLYFRLDSKIEHILIDEFQDTSITQWKIFEPLVMEIASGIGVKPFKTFFYVGDVKQAIYRFRGGRKELFEYVYKTLKPFGMEQISLGTNYRSRKNIVDFINNIFKNEYKDYVDQKIKKPKTQNDQYEGYVEIDTADNIKESLKEILNFMLSKGVKEKDITILVHKNKEILEIEEFLKTELNIQATTSTRAKVVNQKSAKAIISLMKYFFNNNPIEKFNFLSLTGHKFTDNLDLKIKIKKPSLMVKEIMTKYNLTDEAGIKLLEKSFEYDELIDFVTDIDNWNEELPGREFNNLQIMTIHKSKGLEFKHLIVLDMLGKADNKKSNFIFSYEGIKLKDIKIRFQNREYFDEKYKNLTEKESLLEKKDRLNNEYVAFTRAADSLFIIKKEKSFFETDLNDMKLGTFKVIQNDEEKTKKEKFNLTLKNYGMQKYKDSEENEYKPNDYNAIYHGLAIHYMLECENIDAVNNRYGDFINIKKIKNMYMEAKKYLPNGKKEIPYIYESKMGICDLIAEDENKIDIIDYKSVKPEDEKAYFDQINRYKNAIRHITGKETKGFLFYLDEMKFKEVK